MSVNPSEILGFTPLEPTPGILRQQEVDDLFRRGEMPTLDNGWTFVFDVRTDGDTENKIPDAEFTAYFSNRQIPIAMPGHDYHRHDSAHVPTYKDAFAHEPFADLVPVAAANSVQAELTEIFAGAINGIGDCLRTFDDRFARFYELAITDARRNVGELIVLHSLSNPGVSTEAQDALFQDIWAGLGLDWCEAMTEDYLRDRPAHRMRPTLGSSILGLTGKTT